MWVSRIFDVTVLALIAVAILMPRPGVAVKPGLRLDQDGRDRAAELQARLLAAPGDATASLELADLFLDARRPDWALATLAPALDANPTDFRLHGRRSLALADHFEGPAAYRAATKALALCEGGGALPCGEADRARLQLLTSTLEKVRSLDMRQDPNAAKENILHGLHPTFLNRPRAVARDTKSTP